MSATSFLSLVCSIAFFQAAESEPSGKISLRDSLGPTIIPVAVFSRGRSGEAGVRYSSQTRLTVRWLTTSLVHLRSVSRGSSRRSERVGALHGVLFTREGDTRGGQTRGRLGRAFGWDGSSDGILVVAIEHLASAGGRQSLVACSHGVCLPVERERGRVEVRWVEGEVSERGLQMAARCIHTCCGLW